MSTRKYDDRRRCHHYYYCPFTVEVRCPLFGEQRRFLLRLFPAKDKRELKMILRLLLRLIRPRFFVFRLLVFRLSFAVGRSFALLTGALFTQGGYRTRSFSFVPDG